MIDAHKQTDTEKELGSQKKNKKQKTTTHFTQYIVHVQQCILGYSWKLDDEPVHLVPEQTERKKNSKHLHCVSQYNNNVNNDII